MINIKPSYSGISTVANNNCYIGTDITTDLVTVGNAVTMARSLTVVGNTTLGASNFSRVRRNLNVDNALRIGYADSTDVGAGLGYFKASITN